MGSPVNREQFADYCLRRLGKGATRINVTTEQIEDRIDDAIKFWRDYHHSATERTYFKHQITAENKQTGYIEVPSDILEVVRVLDGGLSFGGSVFSTLNYAKYQFLMKEIWNLTSRPISPYIFAMRHLETIDEQLGLKVGFKFNRYSNKIRLDTNWNLLLQGDYLIFDVYTTIANSEEVWGDRWLQKYATALIKYQWGTNITKFRSVQLLNGMEFNGEQIMQDAQEEIRLIEENMIKDYSLPPLPLIA